MDLRTSDWVLIGTTTILAISALFVPYLAEWLKRKYFSPKLEITFKETPRLRHKTRYRDPTEPVYYFRFEVVNNGMAQAKQCEIVLEKLWSYDNTIIPQNHPQFAPVNLLWTGTDELFIDINPGRRVIGNIGHISSQIYQQVYEKDFFVDMIGVVGNHLRFRFDTPRNQIIYAQPNSLIKGDYIVQIRLYSENAENKEVFLKISWSEEWKSNPEEMFREIIISRTEPPISEFNNLDASNLYYDSIYRKIYEV